MRRRAHGLGHWPESICSVRPETCGHSDMPSTVIRSYRYDAATQDLRIVFQTGRRYIYKEVPQETFDGMKAAFSKGEFFNEHIRERFRFIRDPDSESD
jgi:lysyl-tRNA synthetase class 2